MQNAIQTLKHRLFVVPAAKRAPLCCATTIAALLVAGAPSAALASPPEGAGYGTGYAGNADYDSAPLGGRARHAVIGPTHRVHPPRQRQASTRRSRGRQVASLGRDFDPAPRTSVTGGVRWSASSSCLSGQLQAVIAQVAANFGAVTVNSTCRSRGHNARVGGAHRSHHLTGNAVDFRVRGNASAAYAYLRSSGSVGGLKHYGGGLFHIDTGPRRSW